MQLCSIYFNTKPTNNTGKDFKQRGLRLQKATPVVHN